MLAYVDSIVMSDAPSTQTTEQPVTTKPAAQPLTVEPTKMEFTGTNSELFNVALNAQQKNNLDEALNAYNQILKSPLLTKGQASVVHHNKSIIFLQKNDSAQAQIENYLSLSFNPSNTSAINLNKSDEHFKNSIIQTDRSWSTKASLKIIPPEVIFLMILICFLIGSRIFIAHLKSRTLALQDNLEMPNISIVFKVLIVAIAVLGFVLGVRYYDENIVKALVISENTEVSASAGANQAVITSINPGIEVIVLRQQKIDDMQYVQIKSTGQFSGWVKAENIKISNPDKIMSQQ
jgi:hypothetical protein